jgi:hypothetical protein
MFSTLLLLAALASTSSIDTKAEDSGVQAMLNEESPDVFLAKATLQQYLSRVVRKDWEGARRLTHPKTLGVIAQLKKRTGGERHNLAPWANGMEQLKTFRFTESRQVAPGVVVVQVGEDTYRTEEQGMSVDDPGVYILFKSHGGFLIGDKKAGVELAELSTQSVRLGYPGYVDAQVKAQARREAAILNGKHR